ncbi:MAG TPA: ROK family protein [Flavitalea sp.]|nr:ROK family protein [Flavitalea sp.]
MNSRLWGIDLGGTKIEGVVLESLENPKPLVRLRVDAEAQKGYDSILLQIRKLVQMMEQESGQPPKKIGFGTPGVLDPMLMTMKNCNSTALNGQPLQEDLEKLLGVPVALANDANCFALAETKWGIVKEKAPEAKVVFGIIMGTGVGGGLVFHGALWNGKHGIGGEWGHNFLDESGGPCYCGKTGCVEKILSGPSLEKYYTSITGNKLKLREIIGRHESGNDEAAKKTVERLIHFFGKAISVVTNILDPDVYVIGGGVGNIDLIYTEGARSLQQFIFNNRVDVQILKPSLGDSAGVFGAAALVDNQ